MSEQAKSLDWGPGIMGVSVKRQEKLKSILGEEWFKGKTVLDVGAGHGANGLAAASWGANVTYTEGRPGNIEALRVAGFTVHQQDHDEPWTLHGHFDLIIHWGLLYHLKNWEQDLACALERSSLISLETEICDSSDPYYANPHQEQDHFTQALNRIGTTPSAANVERVLTSLGATYTRYDDADLDGAHYHRFSWKEEGKGAFSDGQRRFWIVRR